MPKVILDRPLLFWGKVTIDFFQNDDENWKKRALIQLIKAARKEWNVSLTDIEESAWVNTEKGVVVFSFVAKNQDQGQAMLQKFLSFLDENCQGRILSEDYQTQELE